MLVLQRYNERCPDCGEEAYWEWEDEDSEVFVSEKVRGESERVDDG